MKRRDFLRITALSAAGLTVTAREDAASHPDLLSLLGPEAVRDIGGQYRLLVPAENNRLFLRAAILPSRVSIAAMVRRDFETGRTVLVNGWVLSATEARQCALFSLLP